MSSEVCPVGGTTRDGSNHCRPAPRFAMVRVWGLTDLLPRSETCRPPIQAHLRPRTVLHRCEGPLNNPKGQQQIRLQVVGLGSQFLYQFGE